MFYPHESLMNHNVFQIAEFTGPPAVLTLFRRVGPKPIIVHIEGYLFVFRFESVAFANSILQLLKGIHQGIQGMAFLGALGPIVTDFSIPLPLPGFVPRGVGNAVVDAGLFTFGAVTGGRKIGEDLFEVLKQVRHT
jgi:hypothetical protein